MSLRFWIGGSGSGKSRGLQEEIIERAQAEPGRQFILVVPDQFTMQTQKEIVERHPDKGILNIDVQSFGRLCYRLTAELGGAERIVLDDTGKNLILRRLAGRLKGELPTIGSSLHKTGYIHEVKSVISEFMQYGLGLEEVGRLIDYAGAKPLLKGKLQDIRRLYAEFSDYLGEHYITKEEKLDQLARDIARSKQMRGAVVAFDGFTGFTPVQNNVITRMMGVCSELIFTIIVSAEELEEYRGTDGEHRLFSLSIKTMRSLEQLAADAGFPRGEDRCFYGRPVERYRGRPALAHLEQEIFRRGGSVYPGEQTELQMFAAQEPVAELTEIFARIRELCYGQGMAFRDIAVVSGDLARYAPDAERLAAAYGIPVFLDQNRGLALNPFTEFLRGLFHTVTDDFRLESVMQLHKSGMSGLDEDAVCALENYLYATGLRGRGAWEKPFERCPRYLAGAEDAALAAINESRCATVALVRPLLELRGGAPAEEISRAVYEIITGRQSYEALEAYAAGFRESGDEIRQKEYEQVYRYVMELLEQIASLLEGEVLTPAEYLEILEAGILEIQVGVLPQDVDRVVIGDMERTRLKPVRVLFFAGCNDGVIPRLSTSGGMISDTEREFLAGAGLPLAPTPREQMFIQRLYLYHTLSRPSERLVLSYSAMDRSGASIRPSYLIGRVRELFPALEIEEISRRPAAETILCGVDDIAPLSRLLADYARGTLPEGEERLLYTVYDDARRREPVLARRLAERAFWSYHPKRLSGRAAHSLYGTVLRGSVSRLERYAACAYAHFLQYGLRLRERETSALARSEIGSIFHTILEEFGRCLQERGLRWRELTDEQASGILRELGAVYLERAEAQRLRQDARSAYQFERIQRILLRSVLTMRYQLGKGEFEPAYYEVSFSDRIPLHAGEMYLNGRIDRIDRMERDGRLYLKVVDYKSGEKRLDYAQLYDGRQLQLPVYLDEAVRQLRAASPEREIVPAAVLYYRLQDPLQAAEGGEVIGSPAEALKMRGLIGSSPEIIAGIDRSGSGKSDVAELSWKKDGSLSALSKVATTEEIGWLLGYTERKLAELGSGILAGEKAIRPADRRACGYCDQRECCPYDAMLLGYREGGAGLTQEEARARIFCPEENKSAPADSGESGSAAAADGMRRESAPAEDGEA